MPLPIAELLGDFSLEITGKDIPALQEAQPFLPAGTRVNITFLGNEDLRMRTAAAAAVRRAGLVPVPHLSARRLASESALTEFLQALRRDGVGDQVFVVAGDPVQPEGPYEDALALITAAPLSAHGVRAVSISGYPEGHPEIGTGALWTALVDKAQTLAAQGKEGDIITQLAFDVDPVVRWIEKVRERGVDLPIRVGVPGPAGVKRLLGYARRLGVGTSAGIAKKYGLSLTNMMSTAGPDRFITDLAARLDPAAHGTIRLHFYTFGGLRTTAQWIHEFTVRQTTASSGAIQP
ncbi:methylenetetrahydrofolate reductase [Streptomyces sp. NPDC007084]|uniref:methylenetetrahydrofolate reductase n=1 Tax=Streptomyces sp. NPDC007084 TaxID=3154313 RepID=UPI003456B5ED